MSSRFARQELIPGWSQGRLGDATVIIVGVGAVGNEVARLLALGGIPRMLLCDPDVVEESNLSRTTLFRTSDVGRLKAEAAADALHALAPHLTVDARPVPLTQGIGLGELRDASLVFSCLDTRSSRLQLAGRCMLVRARSIDGGTHPWGGEVRPFLDAGGPCYGCTLTADERSQSDSPWNCMAPTLHTPRGASAFTSALVGAWMASIGMRFMMGLAVPPGLLRIDVATGSTVVVDIEKKDDCPLHRPAGGATPIPVGTRNTFGDLRAALDEGSVVWAWQPVQERVECPGCGFAEERWAIPRRARCPCCDAFLRTRTTLDLHSVPRDITLSEVGIPPREILYVKEPCGEAWVEIGA